VLYLVNCTPVTNASFMVISLKCVSFILNLLPAFTPRDRFYIRAILAILCLLNGVNGNCQVALIKSYQALLQLCHYSKALFVYLSVCLSACLCVCLCVNPGVTNHKPLHVDFRRVMHGMHEDWDIYPFAGHTPNTYLNVPHRQSVFPQTFPFPRHFPSPSSRLCHLNVTLIDCLLLTSFSLFYATVALT